MVLLLLRILQKCALLRRYRSHSGERLYLYCLYYIVYVHINIHICTYTIQLHIYIYIYISMCIHGQIITMSTLAICQWTESSQDRSTLASKNRSWCQLIHLHSSVQKADWRERMRKHFTAGAIYLARVAVTTFDIRPIVWLIKESAKSQGKQACVGRSMWSSLIPACVGVCLGQFGCYLHVP